MSFKLMMYHILTSNHSYMQWLHMVLVSVRCNKLYCLCFVVYMLNAD